MVENQNQQAPLPVKIKKPLWKIITIIVSTLLIISIIVAFFIIDNNNKVLNSWKDLYKEANENNLNQEQKIRDYEQKIKENESTIAQLGQDKERLRQDLRRYFDDLTIEQEITSALLCDKGSRDFTDVKF